MASAFSKKTYSEGCVPSKKGLRTKPSEARNASHSEGCGPSKKGLFEERARKAPRSDEKSKQLSEGCVTLSGSLGNNCKSKK